MQSEYRGVCGYVGDDSMALARERVAEAGMCLLLFSFLFFCLL